MRSHAWGKALPSHLSVNIIRDCDVYIALLNSHQLYEIGTTLRFADQGKKDKLYNLLQVTEP